MSTLLGTSVKHHACISDWLHFAFTFILYIHINITVTQTFLPIIWKTMMSYCGFTYCSHSLTRHFDVVIFLLRYFPCHSSLPPQFKYAYSQLVKQTDQKKETVKFRNGSILVWAHLTGHLGDLLWQHIRQKLTLLSNKITSKIERMWWWWWGERGFGDGGRGERVDETSLLTNNIKKCLKHKELEKRKPIREGVKMMQREHGRCWDNVRREFRKRRREVKRGWQKNKRRKMSCLNAGRGVHVWKDVW